MVHWEHVDGFFRTLSYWHWFGMGAALLVIELLSGSGFLFWVGLSALLTGGLKWLVPLIIWPWQLLFFSVFSIVVAVGWWRYLKSSPGESQSDTLSQGNLQYVGRNFILKEAVENGLGTIYVDDSRWSIRCEQDFPAGSTVLITGVDGVYLIAEKCD